MKNKASEPAKQRIFCPFCDEEILEAQYPFCQACKIEIFYCPKCHKPLPRDKRTCPSCGTDIKSK